MLKRTRLLILTATLSISSVILAGAIAFDLFAQKNSVSATENKEFAEPGSVPIGGAFTLVDDTGRTVSNADFVDSYRLVFFGFTHCPDICPTSLGEIAVTMESLGADRRFVTPMFITVDPERDTPDVMREYVEAFHPSIVGLTGSKQQIERVAQTYRTFFEKDEGPAGGSSSDASDTANSGDYTMNHQGNTYLMSPGGEYLRHFSYGTSSEEMAASIRRAIDKFGPPNQEEDA